jgi:aryl carrier-like protein
VAGEIYIGGAGVARGYLNRPELTAERFVADPFSSSPRARMYKTGDLGRWHTDGRIEYLGRNDFQVKIRGFRIELGEIESKLLACSGVKEAVVLAREDLPGDKRLVAYLVPQAHASLSPAGLRTELASSLAEYMVPSAFVILNALPLTPNGKLDRKALPAPDSSAVTTSAYEPPQGETEAALARIWQDLLGIERIGRHDHFFELGGHSLMTIELMARMREQGLQVEVRSVFSAHTLAALAATVTRDVQASTYVAPVNPLADAFEASQALDNEEEIRI